MALAYEEQMKIAAEASARLKKSYLLRHIPTGLYYKPATAEHSATKERSISPRKLHNLYQALF